MSSKTRGRIRSSSNRTTSSLLIPSGQYHQTELDKTRQEAVAMKSKIRSLELEVETLKQRLDGLRKAKNTTIIKREREEIHIQPPNSGRHYSVDLTSSSASSRYSLISNSQTVLEEKHIILQDQLSQKDNELRESREEIVKLSSNKSELEQRLEKMQTDHDQIMREMKNKLMETELALQKETKKSKEINIHVQCIAIEEKEGLLQELERLRSENKELASQLSELIDANVTLRESNELMQGKCELLLEDLSLKEAKWTEKEQQLQAEIRRQWGERYHEWITKAEQKMEELQKVNTLLQSLLRTKAHNPDLQ